MNADLVFRGGRVWTAGPASGTTDALAVADGRVAALGSADVDLLVGSATTVVDLDGRLLMPGFVDAHAHFVSGGFALRRVDLREARTREAVRSAVAAHAAATATGWILGGGWNQEAWGGASPDRSWLDDLVPKRPVLLGRHDGHTALANSHALRLAGIDASTSDPGGGLVERDAEGQPTGILKERAILLVSRLAPGWTPDEADRALADACAHALSFGVTQVHDMGRLDRPESWAHFEAYRRAGAEELPLRVHALLPLSTWERVAELVADEGRGDDRLGWGGVKGFVDGSLGSATAWFHAPYADVEHGGMMITEERELRRQILGSASAGLQPVVHAIGDRANDWLLDVYEEAAARHEGPLHPRVEHAQHLSPGAPRRFADLGVTASVQPVHLVDDGPWAARRLGPERVRRSYPVRSLMDAGVGVAFGSDWTVAPLDPWAGVVAAVTRALDPARPDDAWIPEQRITLAQALEAYTWGSARAGGRERTTGHLGAGARADCVVLSDDPFDAPLEGLRGIRVERTYVGGRLAWEA